MNCETLQEYLDRYGSLVADRARQAFEPLHVPATDAVVTTGPQAADVARPGPCRHGGGQDPQSAEVRLPVLRMRHGQEPDGGMHGPCPCGRETLPGDRHVPAASGRDLAGRVAAGFPPGHGRGSRSGKVDENCSPIPETKPTKPTWLIMGETVAKNGPLLAGGRREGSSRHSPLPGLRSPVAGEGQRGRQFSQHEGPGAVPKAMYGRNRRRFRQGRQSRHPAL